MTPLSMTISILIFKIFEPSLSDERKDNEDEYLISAQKAFDLDPNDPDSLINKAFGYMITNDEAKYREFVEKAAQINPHHPKSLTSFGILMVREAGGYVTDSSGKPKISKNSAIISANTHIHHELLKILRL